MNAHERLTTPTFGDMPVGFFNQHQRQLRRATASCWAATTSIGTIGILHHVRVAPDGTVDTVRCDSDKDAWYRPAGHLPGDMMAGRL